MIIIGADSRCVPAACVLCGEKPELLADTRVGGLRQQVYIFACACDWALANDVYESLQEGLQALLEKEPPLPPGGVDVVGS